MISSAAKLALNACIFMANFEPDRPLFRLPLICKNIGSPEPYTSKVLSNLVKYKILYSNRGPKGGFGLNKSSSLIRVLQIIEATNDLETIEMCFLNERSCSSLEPCSMHPYFTSARASLYKALYNTTLFDIKTNKSILH